MFEDGCNTFTMFMGSYISDNKTARRDQRQGAFDHDRIYVQMAVPRQECQLIPQCMYTMCTCMLYVNTA